jgi:hypothetical protein
MVLYPTGLYSLAGVLEAPDKHLTLQESYRAVKRTRAARILVCLQSRTRIAT